MIPDKVKNALKILEKYNKWKNKYVCFSGGKDSLVCLDLCHNAWDNFKVIYIEITGNTHPKCTKYVRKVANEYNAELIHIKYWENFFDVLRKLGYPSVLWQGSRWCMHKFKDKPMSVLAKKEELTITVSGVKQGDSVKRRSWISRAVINGVVKTPRKAYCWGKVQIYPLYNWMREDVWEYIREKSLPLNPLYDVLGGAGNCIICPAMKKTEFLAVAEHCPEIFCRWKEVHEKLKKDYNNNTLRGMRVVFHKFDEWYETYCKNTSLNDFIR